MEKVLFEDFDFLNIKKYLGIEWIEEQQKIIKSGSWVSGPEGSEKYVPLGFRILHEIDKLIYKFEGLVGFEKWAMEAKTAKENFNDFLFELMALDVFIKKSDNLTLKTKTTRRGKEPEAFVEKEGKGIFLECTNLKGIPILIEQKVSRLFNKSTSKFDGGEGIHLVGTLGFFDNDKGKDNFDLLIKSIEKRFNNYGSTVIAFILINVYMQYVPKVNVVKPVREYYIIPNPRKLSKYGITFIESLMDVEEFKRFEKKF